MTPIETDRLRLRELRPDEDAGFILLILNEPAFIRNVGDRGVRTVAEAASYIRDRIVPGYQKNGFGMWLVELKQTCQPVGICGLLKRDTLPDVDLGFSFLESFWSRGYAFEAASATMHHGWTVAQLPRIVAISVMHNAASIRLLEKLGFRFEKKIQLMPNDPELLLYSVTQQT